MYAQCVLSNHSSLKHPASHLSSKEVCVKKPHKKKQKKNYPRPHHPKTPKHQQQQNKVVTWSRKTTVINVTIINYCILRSRAKLLMKIIKMAIHNFQESTLCRLFYFGVLQRWTMMMHIRKNYKLDIVTLLSYNSSFRSTFSSSTSNTSVAPPAHITGKGGTLQTDQAYIITSLFSTVFFSAEDWEASSVNLLSVRVMFVTVSTAEVLKKDNP